MHFFVVKIKYVVFAVLAAVFVGVICLTSGGSVMTFPVGGREIPIYSVKRDDNKIALTFDCAWNDDDIDEIIQALKKYDCKATFFVTGKWAEDYSASLNKLYRNGFEIGIHSYNHDDYTKMTSEEILKDMQKCDNAILKATGGKTMLARVPSGAYDNNSVYTIEKSGRYCLQWSVDGLDYIDTTEEEIFNRVVSKTQSGDIILLHNGTKLTAKVLPSILGKLKQKYEMVNISDLIYKENFSVDHAGKQSLNTMY